MAVPTKNQLHRVILEVAAETAQALSRRDVVELVSARLSLTEEDLAEQSSSAVFRVMDRTDWAMFDLRRAGYLYRPAGDASLSRQKAGLSSALTKAR